MLRFEIGKSLPEGEQIGLYRFAMFERGYHEFVVMDIFKPFVFQADRGRWAAIH